MPLHFADGGGGAERGKRWIVEPAAEGGQDGGSLLFSAVSPGSLLYSRGCILPRGLHKAGSVPPYPQPRPAAPHAAASGMGSLDLNLSCLSLAPASFFGLEAGPAQALVGLRVQPNSAHVCSHACVCETSVEGGKGDPQRPCGPRPGSHTGVRGHWAAWRRRLNICVPQSHRLKS